MIDILPQIISYHNSATANNQLPQFSYRKNYKPYNGKNDKVAIQQKD